jgi:hypothetical protein
VRGQLTRPSSPYVIDVADEFLRTTQAREPKTLAAYAGILRGSDHGTEKPLGPPFAPHFQNRRFDTLTHDDIAEWFAQRVGRGAQVTKHRISKNSRASLRFARERGYTRRDLAAAIDVYRGRMFEACRAHLALNPLRSPGLGRS